MDILGVSELVAEEKGDHFDAEAASIDVVPQEKHLFGLRRAIFIKKIN